LGLPTHQRFDGGLAVLTERPGAVVHDALVVVLHPEVGDVGAGILVEVVRVPVEDVLPIDLDVLVPLRGALLVVEAECVQQLVHHHAMGDALGRVQVEHLATGAPSDARPAARVVALDENPVLVTLFVRPKADAGAVVVLLEGLQDHHGLVGGCSDGEFGRITFAAGWRRILTEVLGIYVEGHGGFWPGEALVEQPVPQQLAVQHDVSLEEAAVLPDVCLAVLRPEVEGGT